MEIVINAKTINEDYILSKDQINEYSQIIYNWHKELSSTLNLEKLKTIIIPENYKEELFAFQRSYGYEETMTDNKYWQGYAMTLTMKTNEGIEFVIFVNKDLLLPSIFYSIDEDVKKTVEELNFTNVLNSALIKNTIHHEFAHVHEISMHNTIDWLVNPFGMDIITNVYTRWCLFIWSEYCACRLSYTSRFRDENDIGETFTSTKNLEAVIMKSQERYRKGDEDKKEKLTCVKEPLLLLITKLAYFLGNYYDIINDVNFKKIMNEISNESVVGLVLYPLEAAFENLYKSFPVWESVGVLIALEKVITLYMDFFNIPKNDIVYIDI